MHQAAELRSDHDRHGQVHQVAAENEITEATHDPSRSPRAGNIRDRRRSRSTNAFERTRAPPQAHQLLNWRGFSPVSGIT